MSIQTKNSLLKSGIIVFDAFVIELIDSISNKNKFFSILEEFSSKHTKEHILRLKKNHISTMSWAVDLDEKTLGDIIKIMYVTCCDMLGPVAADNLFHKTISSCDKVPETKEFPVKRFL